MLELEELSMKFNDKVLYEKVNLVFDKSGFFFMAKLHY